MPIDHQLIFWIFLGVAALCIILVVLVKDKTWKVLLVLVVGAAILGAFVEDEAIIIGSPITFLPHGKTLVVICSQRLNDDGIDYAILYLAEVRSDKTLGEPRFYKIETWRLRDKSKERISEIPFRFEVLEFTDSIINENAEHSWEKVQKETLYCIIPR